VRNKACLVSQGFSQVEGLDFGKTFALVANFEVIRILLAFAASKKFKLYEIDVKNIFQNGVIHEKVYVRQPQILRTSSILIEYTSSQKFCTG
jgi:hypothetical protein